MASSPTPYFPGDTSTLVSATWLKDHISEPNLIIVDCRFSLDNPALGRIQYEEGHIPGAVYFDLNQDLSSVPQKHGGRHPLPDLADLVNKLAAAGISSEDTDHPSHVVVYDDSRFAFAARFWWLLRYLGHERVSLLDGGFQGWQKAGFPMTTDLPTSSVGQFRPRIQQDWVVDREQVQMAQTHSSVVLVDSRTGDRYRGEFEPIDPIAGHIPGAVNYSWLEVTDEQGYGRSPEEQQQRWAGLPEESDLIVYCGSGVTACVNLLSLQLAGRPEGRLYAGSWSDWCSYLISPL
ncbi:MULTISPECIES: sulfurtransferase [unclassified Leptolyngbya]|uniref:sulfurtransferase n=1 Tax=unclassified Leptolyngbya TaxID=2650499 RepID=UPI00168407F3|nr:MULTISPECIES: sulfurtransferase [unclassified Leptolyngbya]MBD1913597.1 sulfurtransferase [Leptolyngbya sp. FACHB-8]MBD2155768.1 sulfurtransferase [Leptolyngbya sp. FACHB-16]